jgi:gas vesicle protein/predicted flap endonuclease-1-like 5' DNA nuclease
MGSFFRGILIGIGLSFLFAPMPGQQTRRLVSERLQQLSRSFSGNGQLQQASQRAVNQVTQTAKTVKDNVVQAIPATQPKAQQAVDQVAQTAKTLKDNIAQAPSEPSIPAQQPTSTVQQTGSQAKPKVTSSNNEPLGIMEDMSTEMKARLEAQGIQNTSQLLEHTQTKEERSELAYQSNVNDSDLREYVYRADLMRLTGVGEDTAMLLEEVGVNGCKDLRQRNPQHLHNKLAELQANAHIASTAPTQDQIAQWISQAKQLTNS